MRVLCALLPLLRTERLTRGTPEPARPLVVAAEVGNTARVVAASRSAQKFGVRAGMTLTEARALCPTLEASRHDEPGEAAALESVAALCQRFSPVVMLAPPDALLIDIAGCERLYPSEAHLLADVRYKLATIGYTSRVAIADNPTQALALAAGADKRETIAPDGEGIATVEPLSIEHARLAPADADLLDVLGLRTIGDLLALPRATVPSRFSPALLARIKNLTAEIIEPFEPYQLPDHITERIDFAGQTDRRDALMFALRRAATFLSERLFSAAVGARQLDVLFTVEEGRGVSFTIDLVRAAVDSRNLAAVLLAKFERVDTEEKWFTGLIVSAGAVETLRSRQRDLFDEEAHDRHAGTLLLDELVGRLGKDAVSQAELVHDPRPERGYRFTPFGSPRRAEPPPAPAVHRPLYVDARAVSVTVDEAGHPLTMARGNRAEPVRVVRGPERVVFGWWEEDGPREYYIVEDASGARWWLVHEVDENRWIVAGEF